MKLPNPRLTENTHLYTDPRADKYGVFADEDAVIIALLDLFFILMLVVLCVIAIVRLW